MISVIGLGYVGLPTAVLLANAGNKVRGIDINEQYLSKIANCEIETEDIELNNMLSKVLNNENLTLENKISESDVFIIAVPTLVVDNEICLDHIKAVCAELVKVLKKGDLVIVESTIAPGTTETAIKSMLETNGLSGIDDFYLAHMPERVKPGNTLNELVYNDRVVGGVTPKAAELAKKVYESFVKSEIKETDALTAEMVKVVENTFRDINIAFANEVLTICEEAKADPWKVIELANMHPRVNIHRPGPGVGGYCIPVVPWFLAQLAPNEAKIIKESRARNDYMPIKVANDIKKIMDKNNLSKVLLLGTTYAGNVKETRFSPTLDIIKELESLNINYSAYDPISRDKLENQENDFTKAISGAELVVFLVGHDIFKEITAEELKKYGVLEIFDCTGQIYLQHLDQKEIKVHVLGKLDI
ncbi:nucleotide sugar dehydrogenase [uncultured Tissierella sp.]|uniref:nucleotide sugar dehydrogenase n=1 Tax=uncultured Tissierella sp. TaxID=448160 RepID=UPI002805F6DD|nr:nucleotide sugar dehydrogenase [uncultured Tissierella sp.]MDU5080507.1 nucleotide sugar dehydrogenase [Bacillota bacterium]